MTIKFLLLNSDAVVPTKQHHDDSGYDLYSLDTKALKPGEISLFKLGFSIEIPVGYEMQIRSRSGLALKHGIIVLNSPGTVDSGYRGELGVILFNTSAEPYVVNKYDRIAQAVFCKVEDVEWKLSTQLGGTARKKGGYGSTGR